MRACVNSVVLQLAGGWAHGTQVKKRGEELAEGCRLDQRTHACQRGQSGAFSARVGRGEAAASSGAAKILARARLAAAAVSRRPQGKDFSPFVYMTTQVLLPQVKMLLLLLSEARGI